MDTMATNHVAVATGQVATTSLPGSGHYFFPTTFSLVTMARSCFSRCNNILILNERMGVECSKIKEVQS